MFTEEADAADPTDEPLIDFSQPARAERATAIYGVPYDDDAAGIISRCWQMLGMLDTVTTAAGAHANHNYTIRKGLEEVSRQAGVNAIAVREFAWCYLNELRRIVSSPEPLSATVQIAPRHPKAWGRPFDRPLSQVEQNRRAAARSEQDAADLRRAREQRATAELSYLIQGKGILFRLDNGVVVASPASWLTDQNRATIQEFLPEIRTILADEVRFGQATLETRPARSRPKSAGEPRASAA